MQRRRFIAASIGAGLFAALGGAGIAWRRPAPGAMQREPGVQGLQLYSASEQAFGTVISARVLHDNRRLAELALDNALGEARRVDRLMSIFDPGSEVHRLNALGYLERPSPALVFLLRQAEAMARLTEGRFDVTVQPLWQAYRDAQARGMLPDLATLHQRRALVDWRRLDIGAGALRFREPGMAITLNGMAQGYAADMALSVMRLRGIGHALLDMGEFTATGEAEGGRPWSIGIAHPRQSGRLLARLEMDGRAVATSGDYACSFSADYACHHILDPRSGASPDELASVTVVAPSGLLADMLSTAFLLTGSRRALEIAGGMPDVDVFLVDKTGRLRAHSPNFRSREAHGMQEFLRVKAFS